MDPLSTKLEHFLHLNESYPCSLSRIFEVYGEPVSGLIEDRWIFYF